jgi:hypothetical protein
VSTFGATTVRSLGRANLSALEKRVEGRVALPVGGRDAGLFGADAEELHEREPVPVGLTCEREGPVEVRVAGLSGRRGGGDHEDAEDESERERFAKHFAPRMQTLAMTACCE